MADDIKQIEGPIRKVLEGLKRDPNYLRLYHSGKELTVQNFMDAVSNHLLTDKITKYYEHFGITEKQGHEIREYIHNSDDPQKELIETFPDLME